MGSDPINNKTLGGVTYNANQFIGRDLGNGKFELKAKHGGETLIFGQQDHTEVKAGNKVPDYYRYSDGSTNETGENRWINDHYETGEPMRKANPSIKMKTDDGLFVDDNEFTIADMMGATFTSSTDTVANVYVDNSSDVKIDLAANNSKLFGDYAEIHGGENNEVIMDSKDRAQLEGHEVEGEGTAAQKDYKKE